MKPIIITPDSQVIDLSLVTKIGIRSIQGEYFICMWAGSNVEVFNRPVRSYNAASALVKRIGNMKLRNSHTEMYDWEVLVKDATEYCKEKEVNL